MKTKPKSVTSTSLFWAIMSFGLGICSAHAQQNTEQLNVGVRTQLDSQKRIWDGVHSHKSETKEHGKVYAILMIQPTNAERKLVKRVNAAVIKEELMRQLDAQGYHYVQPTQKPDILISVIYGRSYLPNPYLTDKIDVDNMGPEMLAETRDYTVFPEDPQHPWSSPRGMVVENPNLAARLSIPSISHKASQAGYEKLFILVRAFKYPPPADPKKKPEVLWVTTMYVDDPDHRDLNAIAQQMLEAGAPFFDREIKDEEAFVRKTLPDGRVNVGTPEVVESDAKK